MVVSLNEEMGTLFDKGRDEEAPSSQEIKKVRTPTPTRSSPKKKDVKKIVKKAKSSQFFDETAKHSDSDSQDDFQSEQSSTTDSESEQSSQQSRQTKEVIVIDSSEDDKKHEQTKKRQRSEPAKLPLSTRRTRSTTQSIKLQITPPSSLASDVANQTISNNQMDTEANKENVENFSTPKLEKTRAKSSSTKAQKKLSLKPDSKSEYALVPLITENNANNNNQNATFSKSPTKRNRDAIETNEEEAIEPSSAPATPKGKSSKLESDVGEAKTPSPKKSKPSKPPTTKTIKTISKKTVKATSPSSKSPSSPVTTPLSSKKSSWKKKKQEENSTSENNTVEVAISPSIAKSKKKYTKKSPSKSSSTSQNDNTDATQNNNNFTTHTTTDANGNEIARMLQNLPTDQVQAVRPPTRHPRSWEDVARFARVDFSKPSTPKPQKYTLSVGTPLSPITEPVGSPDPNKKKKKKGRVQAALNLPQKVPTLQTLCVELVCKYIDCVESFGILPPGVQSCLSMTLAKHRKLNATSLKLFLEAGVTELTLTNCAELDPPSLSLISTCPDLDTISLIQCGRLNDETLSAIAKGCPNLKNIELNGCYQVSDASLCELVSTHPKIHRLSLHWLHRFSIEFAKTLSENCPEIRELHLARCTQVDDAILQQLQGLKNLEIFTLDEAPLVTDDGIHCFLQNAAKSLQTVSITHCEKVTEKGLSGLAACTGLTSLHLSGFEKLTDDGVFTFMESKNLRKLTLQECPHISDKSVVAVLKQMSLSLQHLNLQNLQITEESAQVLSGCSKLEVLNLSWSRGIDDVSIESILKGCHKLKKITLWGCTQVSDMEVSKIIAKGIEVIGKDQFLIQAQ